MQTSSPSGAMPLRAMDLHPGDVLLTYSGRRRDPTRRRITRKHETNGVVRVWGERLGPGGLDIPATAEVMVVRKF